MVRLRPYVEPIRIKLPQGYVNVLWAIGQRHRTVMIGLVVQ